MTNPGVGQSITKYYFAGAARIAMRKYTVPQPMQVEYLLGDHPSTMLRTSLGSVSAILGSTGALVREQRYKPYGEVRGDLAGPVITQTDMGYTGQRAVSGTGLMDYRARFYDPLLYRFVQPDTIVPSAGDPQSWNRYSYVENSPSRFADPSGHRPVILDDGNKPVVDMDWKKTKLSKKYVERRFKWKLSGEWTSSELEMIYRAGYDIEMYVNSITEGKGLAWMYKYLGGTTFKHGSLFGRYNFVMGNTVHLEEGGFVLSSVVHELAHIYDNTTVGPPACLSLTGCGLQIGDFTSKFCDATICGGGNADFLIKFLEVTTWDATTTTLNGPSGLRAWNGTSGVPNGYSYVKGDLYGNNGSAEYFAMAFENMIYDSAAIPNTNVITQMNTLIQIDAGVPVP